MTSIIGQPRGTRAIEFGIRIDSPGYNIYVLGETGTGRTTAIRSFLEERAGGQPCPDDWVYVHNFATPHQPRAIRFPPGKGQVFKAEMGTLLECLKEDLPKAFDAEAYDEVLAEVTHSFEAEREKLLTRLRSEAADQGFALLSSASGWVIAPVADGQVIQPDEFETLPQEQQELIRTQQSALNDNLDQVLDRLRQIDMELREEIKELNQEVADSSVKHHFSHWRHVYENQEDVLLYLSEIRQDGVEHLGDFFPPEEG
jgi:septin family protein